MVQNSDTRGHDEIRRDAWIAIPQAMQQHGHATRPPRDDVIRKNATCETQHQRQDARRAKPSG